MEPTNPSRPTNEPNATPPSAPVIDPMMKPAESATSIPVNVTPSAAPGAGLEPAVGPEASSPAEPAAPSPLNQPSVDVSNSSTASSVDVAPTPAPVINGVQQNSVVPGVGGSSPKGGKKWLVPALAAGALLLLLGGGYVFGMYLPNQPEAVFSKSLERSGQAADKLIEYAKSQQNAKYAGATIDGTLAVKSASASYDATFKGEGDDNNLNLNVDANISGEKMNLELRALDAAQSESPDIYLKVSGVKDLLQEMGGSKVAALDSQWISVDHTLVDTYTKSLESDAGTSASLQVAPTPEQINDAIAKVQTVNKQYLFTTDKTKAVLQYKSFVGKETVSGRSVNHYKAGYSKVNLKAYVTAVGTALDGSKLNDWAKQQNDGKSISKLMDLKTLQSDIDKNKGTETFDLNIDTETKLVQSMVFTMESSDSPGTLTLEQNYAGGNEYPFKIAVKTTDKMSPVDVVFNVTANTKTNKLDIAIKGSMGSEADVDMTAHITPTDKKVTVTMPTGAKSVNDVMKELGLDSGVLGASTAIPSGLLSPQKQ